MSYTDEILCRKSRAGDKESEETLVLRYARLVRACARPYFLAGADGEDLIQEGMVGLIKAVRDYDPDTGVLFRSFAEILVRRRIYSALRDANRQKHGPLKNYVPLYGKDFDQLMRAEDLSRYAQASPEELLIDKEATFELESALSGLLSKLETQVLILYLRGLTYLEMAENLGKTQKSVDNAVQRIRKKVSLFKGDSR